MKRVFILAPYFPPRRRVGSSRAFRFAIHLRKFGWDPLVVHLKTSNEALSAREYQFLQDIERVELSTPLDRTSSSSGTYAVDHQPVKNKKVPKTNYFGDLFDRAFPVDTWWPVLKYHQKTLQRLIEKFKPDVLWSTADPWSSHLMAMKLAKRHKIPWIADFRDPWSLCPFRSGARMPWARAIDKKVEMNVISRADRVVFTAENTTKLYREHYAGIETPMSTIYNSFDDEFFLPLNQSIKGNSEEDKFNVLFYGRFRALSSADSVIKLLEAVKKINPEVYQTISLQSCGELPKEDKANANKSGVLSAFEKVKAEPYENTLNRLFQADVLLLSTNLTRDEIIPAKLWDYLIAGKPIISLSQNPEVEEILKQTKTGQQFSMQDIDKAAHLLIEYVKKKKRAYTANPYSIEPDKAKIQAYSSVNTTAQLAGLFDQISKG